jgi:hypothetical protein
MTENFQSCASFMTTALVFTEVHLIPQVHANLSGVAFFTDLAFHRLSAPRCGRPGNGGRIFIFPLVVVSLY